MYDWQSAVMWMLMLGTLRALYEVSNSAGDPVAPVRSDDEDAVAPFPGLSPEEGMGGEVGGRVHSAAGEEVAEVGRGHVQG